MTSDTNTHAEQQQEPERKHQHVNIEIDRTEKITHDITQTAKLSIAHEHGPEPVLDVMSLS